MDLKNVYKKIKPLCLDDTGSLIAARGNNVFSLKPCETRTSLFRFTETKFNRFFSFFSLYFRLKRLGVMTAIRSGNDCFFTYGRKIYRYNLQDKRLLSEFSFTQGRGPLKFCEISGVSGFSDSMCFGEYFGNHKRKPIKIFQRKNDGVWLSPFEFNDGEINHIHALVPDVINKCVWILVGDFEHSAAIYMATNDFSKIELIVSGKQCYRACVGFPVAGGLLYATDTQIETNSIRLLSKKLGKWESDKLFDINGSCIYGTELKDFYVFSTSTEPSEKERSFFKRLFDNKPAPGIIENQSDIISIRKLDFNHNIVVSKRKDIWPYRLFQFGTIMFPLNSEKTNILYAYNVGSVTNDLSTECYDLSE